MTGCLKFLSHNIQGGVERKLLFQDILDSISLYDVVFFQETWLIDSNQLNVDGFSILRSDRGSHKKKSTGSGGVVTLYKTSLSKGITKLPSKHKDFMWVKFDKNIFHLESDLYVINCYIPPEDSVVHADTNYDIMEVLFEEVSKYCKLGFVGIAGDLNSRTGNIQENLHGHMNCTDLDLNRINLDSASRNEHIILPTRRNKDSVRNSFGHKLIEIVEANNLMILNGRVLGDSLGNKTCFTHNGSSTVDYFIISERLLDRVNFMKVKPQTWYSDHSPLELSLSVSLKKENRDDTPLVMQKTYIWDEEGKEKLMNLLTLPESQTALTETQKYESVDDCVHFLTQFLQECASKCLKPKKSSTYNGNNIKRSSLHTTECPELSKAKAQFNRSWKNLRLYRNKDRHTEFIRLRSRYKRLKYLYFNYNKEDKLYKLANIESKDPKGFWKTIRTFTKKRVSDCNITPKRWTDYFQNLFNVKSTNIDVTFLEYVKSALPAIENITDKGPLDHEISHLEITKSIKKLRNGKSAGPDGIINEMIKYGGAHLHDTLRNLYNKILCKGQYPTVWQYSTITPIYKALNPSEPTNYRGIAVADIMSKIFTCILNDRLYNYFVENDLWSKNQSGFMKKRQTNDNIFILHTLFQKYVKSKGKKLYVAFIDFSKFFDVINRDILKYKLLKYGVTGKFYEVIKSYYANSYYAVKSSGGVAPYFEANNGVKQGCNLSPAMSNLYQNDIHEIFDNSCGPLELNDMKVNSLSWADDLVIMSDSQTGLQNCLNKLDRYCYKWGLSLNVKKTKFMIMSKGTVRNSGVLTFRGDNIDYVTCYKYLGVQLSSNGKFTQMISDRCTKAQKAIFQLRSALSTTYNVSRKLSLSIFDKQIFPILTYGCAIWGQTSNIDTVSVDFNTPQNLCKKELSNLFRSVTGKEINFEVLRTSNGMRATIRINDPQHKAWLISKQNVGPTPFTIMECSSRSWKLFEKIHTSFCKYVLGVSKYTSNLATLCELGRLPIGIRITLAQILYWLRLEQLEDDSILQCAYIETRENNHDFIQGVKYFLKSNGLGDILDHARFYSPKYVKSLINLRLSDQFVQSLESKLNHFENLLLCKSLFPYKHSGYLDGIENVRIRNIFTRLRINNNKLKAYGHKEDILCHPGLADLASPVGSQEVGCHTLE